MNQDLSNYRRSYERGELLENNISANPLELFQKWFNQVEKNAKEEVNAMTLSTIGLDGFPKARIVLLKKYSAQGFVFFTNYSSEKGKAMEVNSNVCLSFFWESMERQVIIKGQVRKISEVESAEYFHSRPKGSQIGAMISNQSAVIPSREFLDHQLEQATIDFAHKDVEKPINWGGYLVVPQEIEFWQGRENRLHDRIRYQLSSDKSWKLDRLSP